MGSEAGKLKGFAGRKDIVMMEPEHLFIIRDKKDPLYDPRVDEPLEEAMVLSVMARGVRMPILARRNGDQLEVVDGRQRVRAACEANKRLTAEGRPPIRVKCVTDPMGDREAFGDAVMLNEQRRDDSPLAKARKLGRLLAYDYSEEEAGVIFGLSRAGVRNLKLLLEVHDGVQAMVESGKVPASVAIQLAALPRDEQLAEAKRMVDAGVARGMSATEHIEKVKRGSAGKGAPTPVARMRSRKAISTFRARLAPLTGKQSELAQAVLAWVLGDDEALLPFQHVAAIAVTEEG